jgi:hypothetical protein
MPRAAGYTFDGLHEPKLQTHVINHSERDGVWHTNHNSLRSFMSHVHFVEDICF